MSILKRAVRGAISILFVVALAGWGSSEADQRKAFIAFLQDINTRPGTHFLVPTANDEKAFGPYLQHYALILDFDKDMKAPMTISPRKSSSSASDQIPRRAASNKWRRRRRTSRRPRTSSARWSRASKRGSPRSTPTVPRSNNPTT